MYNSGKTFLWSQNVNKVIKADLSWHTDCEVSAVAQQSELTVFLQCVDDVAQHMLSLSTGQSMTAMEMLSRAALSYCHVGKNEGAACRSLLTLCKWLLADWKDMTPQLKQASLPISAALSLFYFVLNFNFVILLGKIWNILEYFLYMLLTIKHKIACLL